MRPEIKNYKAEADADLIPIPGQLELHGRCRCGVLLSACFCAQFVADLTVGMEELELHCRRRGRYNFRKIKLATISVWMVLLHLSRDRRGYCGRVTKSFGLIFRERPQWVDSACLDCPGFLVLCASGAPSRSLRWCLWS